MHARIRRALGTLLSTALLGAGVVALDVPAAHAAYPVPATPSGLTASIEELQPYIGQTLCDPVAKSGVSAFRNLLLATYTDSGSFGIVRDCGSGGQSEHKEGRAFDWKMSASNTRQKAEVQTLLTWLLATDKYGNKYAMARRFGIMYMIWNRQIFKLYDAGKGWQAYSGASAHTDHVHFSFGWNGAKKVTSYWDKTVAPIDFGPSGPPHVTPVRTLANITVVRQYGSMTLSSGSGGTAVKVIQKALLVADVDGDFGSTTKTHVMKFQVDQKLPVTGAFGPTEWRRLFPFPQAPFGTSEVPAYVLGNVVVRGWAIDADTQNPVTVDAVVDGAVASTTAATLPRSDVATSYPEWGGNRGFSLLVPVLEGSHQVCIVARNAATTPGTDTPLGCATVNVQHNPIGAISSLTSALGVVRLTGWAFDPDVTDVLATSLTVDGQPSAVAPTPAPRTDVAALFPGIGDTHGVVAELDLSEGTHQVCLLAPNATGTAGSDATVACQDVKVEHTPVGALQALRRAPGGVLVRGWALDPDVARPADVEVLSDGQLVGGVVADQSYALASTYKAQGGVAGFVTTVDLPVGQHQVCVRVPNADGTTGTDLELPCSTVTVTHDPVGTATALRTVPGGKVLVSGDALDADTTSAAKVGVLVDGALVGTLTANRASTTSEARWPGYGTARGYLASLTLAAGTHRVCLRAENATGTPGAARTLLCRSVVVHNGTGALSSLVRSSRTVTVRGWALDPDSRSATRAVLVVDRRVVASVTANGLRRDLTTLAPGYGSYHAYGFSRTLTRGTHTVCVVAQNLTGTAGSSRYVGCRTVTVP
jgi:peptidoglycan hydrolase-like protein with peptidoglycan-binding domain